jgi:DNA-binding NarL/FixJ family response regulator
MQLSQVVLANEPRLLRGMLKHVITKTPGLQVAGEARDPAELPILIRQAKAQWVIVSLWPEGLLPSAIESLLSEHASVCFLGMAADGSQARIKRAEAPEENLHDLSLGKLLAVLSE